MPSGEIRRSTRTLCDHRSGRQHRPHEREQRQGRAHAPAGPPSARPRHGDEPGRSPDGWRPGQEQGRWRTPSPDVARGASWRRVSRPAASTRAPSRWIVARPQRAQEDFLTRLQPTPNSMSRSLKKGPFVAAHLYEKIDKLNAQRREASDQDLGARVDDRAGFRRAHVPGPQRQDFQLACSSPKTWSATSWASFPRRAPSRSTARTPPRSPSNPFTTSLFHAWVRVAARWQR